MGKEKFIESVAKGFRATKKLVKTKPHIAVFASGSTLAAIGLGLGLASAEGASGVGAIGIGAASTGLVLNTVGTIITRRARRGENSPNK